MVILALAESIQLVPDGTLVLHVAIIVTMVFVLNAILYKPISSILKEREGHTRGRLEEARGIVQRIEGDLLRYENALRQARAEGYRLLEKQQSEAFGERQQKIAIVRKEIEEQVGEEKSTIDAQAEEARTLLVKEARQIATNISSQILGH
jgi:F-type H+-transporting ATPase subunit b